MEYQHTLLNHIAPVIDLVQDEELRNALHGAFAESAESVRTIENCFALIPAARRSDEFLMRFFCSWKASHLKMLAIYGLSCRLQRMAMAEEGTRREELMMASARNAETSYEDLGLDYDAETHAELYDNFAGAFVGEAPWQLEKYCTPAAREFKKWVYRNMVVGDISRGLLTNMFSEIYNHGEYSIALPAFSALADSQRDFSPEERERALLYIAAHIEDATEVGHFLVVVDALSRYNSVAGTTIDYNGAKELFKEYLTRLGNVMEEITVLMHQDESTTTNGSRYDYSTAEGALV